MGDPIREAVTAHWGKRCPDFAPRCPCCEAYGQLERYEAQAAEMTRLRAELAEAKDRIEEMHYEALERSQYDV